MLMRTPSQVTVVFFARMVIPRSRSSANESITRSATFSLAQKTPVWRSITSTRIVFPWSTWTMIAMLQTSARQCTGEDSAMTRTKTPSCRAPRGASTSHGAIPPAHQRRLHDSANPVDDRLAVLTRPARDRLANDHADTHAPWQREHVPAEQLPRLIDR